MNPLRQSPVVLPKWRAYHTVCREVDHQAWAGFERKPITMSNHRAVSSTSLHLPSRHSPLKGDQVIAAFHVSKVAENGRHILVEQVTSKSRAVRSAFLM